jgi:pimeloyl-ACP methyl ester carboxylesterase
MNAQPGTARALARTLSDVVTWRGQGRHFLDYAHRGQRLPPIALFWGDRDDVTPIEDARQFVRSVQHVKLHEFPGSGHYLHHEQPETLALRLQYFLDMPRVRPARVPTESYRPAQPALRVA